MVGTYMIVPKKTGVSYTSQVLGPAQFEQTEEGYLIPFFNYSEKIGRKFKSPSSELSNYFEQHGSGLGISRATADAIEKIINNYNVNAYLKLRVNRKMLKKSCEAWVYVIIDSIDEESVEGISKKQEAILTWVNGG